MTIAATPSVLPGGPAGTEPQHRPNTGHRPRRGASRQRALQDVLSDVAPGTSRLSPSQLRAVSMTVAAHHDLWADLVVRDPDVRWYLPLHRAQSYDVWLLAWERGQDTDWHDHGGSSGSAGGHRRCRG